MLRLTEVLTRDGVGPYAVPMTTTQPTARCIDCDRLLFQADLIWAGRAWYCQPCHRDALRRLAALKA